MPVQRYDQAFIEDFSETSEGYLTVNAPITRPGVFPYMVDGAIEMEAKLPEELFSEQTIQSANAKPVTDDHPTEPVTAGNYSQYAKGMTHTDAAVRNNKLYISFTITDSATIEKVKNGKRELSIGFTADVAKEKGTYGGMSYDSVQKNMMVNHLAIVEKGRAGSEVAIRGDSVAFMIDSNDDILKNGGNTMPVVRIDNKDYEVESVIKARFDALEAQAEAANTRAGNYDAILGERDSLQTQVNTLNQELEAAQKKELTGDALESRVQERVTLVERTKPILGDSFDFKGKSDRDIKEAAIASTNGEFKGDGKSDDYVNAFFDAMIDISKAKGFTAAANFNDAKDKDKEKEEEIEKKKNARLNMKSKGGN